MNSERTIYKMLKRLPLYKDYVSYDVVRKQAYVTIESDNVNIDATIIIDNANIYINYFHNFEYHIIFKIIGTNLKIVHQSSNISIYKTSVIKNRIESVISDIQSIIRKFKISKMISGI